jgi:hypothetical protein
MSTSSANTVQAPQLPAENPVAGTPAVVDPARDLRAEKEAEAKADKAKADAKKSRFEPRRRAAEPGPSSAPEFETMILKSAVNNPLAIYERPATSTFVPNFSPLFFLLNYMDFLMASTKRWIDNCMGWVPPYSQMYISVLLYIQTMRAMEAAGVVSPGSEISNVLLAFDRLYPLNELWIPGPLVLAFRSLSAFWPDGNDRFGNVTPTLPAPGWTRARLGSLDDNLRKYLPNISVFVSRLHHICATATTANMTELVFQNHVNGPNFAREILGVDGDSAANVPASLQNLGACPGASFVYGGNLQLWQNAAARLTMMNVPADVDAATAQFDERNRWTAVMRFDLIDNEHVWFGPVSAMMAKYCQFWNGSVPLGSCPPVSSAAPALKGRIVAPSNILTSPAASNRTGNHNSDAHGHADQRGHIVLRNNARLIQNVRNALVDLPDAHAFAGITFALNAYESQARQTANRLGPFWTLGPDHSGADNVEVLPGVLSTIMREYHSVVRLSPLKQ